jgi:adenine deaminase
MSDLPKLLSVARGDSPADLVLRGGRVVNVFSGEIETVDIAVVDGLIAGLGGNYEAKEVIDLAGAYVAPGYIDAHVHIESSLCVPHEFAAAVVPRGVTTVVTDPHEIANVAGPAGVEFIFNSSRGLPLEVIVMAPSCVPATPMATAGGTIGAADLATLRASNQAHGLAEFMNFPGVIGGDAAVLAKLDAMAGRPVDGHCPGVRGRQLNAYVAAGIGSDHESVDVEEAKEKLARGLYLLIREATNARNLDALIQLVTPANARRVCFCTDDRTPGDLLRDGSIDMMVRRAIKAGVAPIEAIRMATLNTAEWFGLRHIGAVAPGRVANLIVFDDLDEPTPKQVFSRGVSWHGFSTRDSDERTRVENPCHGKLGQCEINWDRFDLKVPARGEKIRVIGLRPDQLVTDHLVLPAKVVDGRVVSDVSNDVLKMTVVGRHNKSNSKQGVGFIKGVGLRRGAIAGTIAHDHHNLVVIGVDDASMTAAAREAERLGGGLVVADGCTILARLALEVGGLMSDRPVEEVSGRYDQLLDAAKSLGSPLNDPFMAMSFMALEVIPSLKLTDHGLVDVEQFRVVDLFI